MPNLPNGAVIISDAENPYVEIAHILIQHGANPDKQTVDGYKPLDLMRKFDPSMNLLLQTASGRPIPDMYKKGLDIERKKIPLK